MKRIVVAGSRSFDNYEIAKDFINECLEKEKFTEPLTLISGGCRGADLLGERYATEHAIPLEVLPAEWDRYGRAAGPIRNKKLAEISDIIICFWDQKSRGTKSLIEHAKRLNKSVYSCNIHEDVL